MTVDRQIPLIADGLEWNLVGRRDLTATRVADRWWYIPNQSFLIQNSFVVQVGIANPTAPSHWYLGAWASMLLPITPSSTTEFVSAVSADSRSLRLGLLNLIVLPKFYNPWILELKIPRWHEQMRIECWRYDGPDVDQFAKFADVEQQVEALGDALDGGV